jgi:hypothetical protein
MSALRRAHPHRLGLAGASLRTAVVVAMLLGCATAVLLAHASRSAPAMLEDHFTGPDGLIASEHPEVLVGDRRARRSPIWRMSSGSLFRRAGEAWTGRPDAGPDACSCRANGSAVFRMVSRRADFDDAAMSFALRTVGLTATERTPARSWDGVHVMLRWQSPQSTYYVTINRRDNRAVIKKKVPGGPANGGTYIDLRPPTAFSVPYGREQHVRATVQTRHDGSVAIRLSVDGKVIAEAVDRGIGGAPIRSPGAVGVRGDNAEFALDDLRVTALR